MVGRRDACAVECPVFSRTFKHMVCALAGAKMCHVAVLRDILSLGCIHGCEHSGLKKWSIHFFEDPAGLLRVHEVHPGICVLPCLVGDKCGHG